MGVGFQAFPWNSHLIGQLVYRRQQSGHPRAEGSHLPRGQGRAGMGHKETGSTTFLIYCEYDVEAVSIGASEELGIRRNEKDKEQVSSLSLPPRSAM